MEKRAFAVMQSPRKPDHQEACKKIKIALSPGKENNFNSLNNQSYEDPGFDINDLCFDDDEEEEFLHSIQMKIDIKPDYLDLSHFKRCIVKNVEVHRKTFEKILHLEEKSTHKLGKCCLKGIWFDSDVAQNDIVSVRAVWKEDRKMFVVSNEAGMIVILPDQLISGTTVVGSLFCARKQVLAERFKGIDFGADSKIMHIGSIVHEILQRSMQENLTTLEEIKRASEDILSSEDMLHLLYSCKMSMKELKDDLNPYLTRIYEFMQQYIVGNSDFSIPSNPNQNVKPFAGKIAEVADIEENVWCPRLGFKGKIDATVTVYPPNKFFNSFRALMPMEIKTGKSSFSLEHKGQLIIYQMMLQDLGKQIDSGLLLYIRDGIMSEVRATNAEKNGIVSMRNRLAKYLNTDLVSRDKTINLPDPISHPTACEKCAYNTICCAFLKKDLKKSLSAKHPLLKLQESAISHLNENHLDYFVRWCHLITLEHNEMQKTVKLKHLWTKSPEARFGKGNALINLSIKELVQPQNSDSFIHVFGEDNESNVDFTSLSFEVGDYLIVSTDKRCSVTAGRIIKIDSRSITMSLSKDLSRQYINERFHLDKHESQSQTVFNFTNIGALLDNDDEKGINRIRAIVVDKAPSIFTKSLPKSIQDVVDKILLQMNSVQRTAILKALTCENYMLIKGLPGTGKSQTLVNLIHILKAMKKSILITSHTNSAVDNILMRLKERGINFLRLGSVSRIHPSLREHCEATLIENCKSVDDLEKFYNQYQIVAVTCLGSGHALLSQRRFDFCLVDEATQIFQPTVLRPLFAADKFILVGDPEQLSPLVKSNDGRLLGANESLFERLDAKGSTFVLGLQYRMNRTITKLANNLTYNGELKCANEIVEKGCMEVPHKERFSCEKWLAKVLSSHLDLACSLINTGDVYEMAKKFMQTMNVESRKSSKLYVNYCEIAIVLHIVDLLIESGVQGESIGIIAPYRDQVEALKKLFESYNSVEVNTVDQYQGRDKKIIIYSCTLSESTSDNQKSSSEVEILEDRRRLTVAITRAKHKLIMIGDVNCLNKYTPFRDLFKHMSGVSKIQVRDDNLGFSWSKLMQQLKVKITED